MVDLCTPQGRLDVGNIPIAMSRHIRALLRRHVVVFMAICLSSFAWGCSTLQQQVNRRAERCASLCEQSREARRHGRTDQAERLLDDAISQTPTDPATRRELVEAMWSAGRHDEAVVEMGNLVQACSHDANLHSRQAELLWLHKNTVGAEAAAESALRLDPQSLSALLVKAKAESERGELKNAIAGYIHLSQLAPDRLDFKLELAELHVRRGHPDQACPLLRDAMRFSQLNSEQVADVEWKLGLAYAAQQRWKDAVIHFDRAMVHRKNSDSDRQCLSALKVLSGHNLGLVDESAIQVSVRNLTDDPANVWTVLRDQIASSRFATEGTGDMVVAEMPDAPVIRADYHRKGSKNEIVDQEARFGDSPTQLMRQSQVFDREESPFIKGKK